MAERLFSEDEITALSAEIQAKTKAALAEPGAEKSVPFTRGSYHAIVASIVTATGAAVRKAQRALDPVLADQRGLVQRADKTTATIESLERRASRHADHLSRLESRLQALEHRDAK